MKIAIIGNCINDKKQYQHSKRLKWTIKALADQLFLLKQKLQLFDNNQEAMQALQAIYDNLNGIDNLLTFYSKKDNIYRNCRNDNKTHFSFLVKIN